MLLSLVFHVPGWNVPGCMCLMKRGCCSDWVLSEVDVLCLQGVSSPPGSSSRAPCSPSRARHLAGANIPPASWSHTSCGGGGSPTERRPSPLKSPLLLSRGSLGPLSVCLSDWPSDHSVGTLWTCGPRAKQRAAVPRMAESAEWGCDSPVPSLCRCLCSRPRPRQRCTSAPRTAPPGTRSGRGSRSSSRSYRPCWCSSPSPSSTGTWAGTDRWFCCCTSCSSDPSSGQCLGCLFMPLGNHCAPRATRHGECVVSRRLSCPPPGPLGGTRPGPATH